MIKRPYHCVKLLQLQFRKMLIKLENNYKCFGGEQRIYSHVSTVLRCEMKFGVFLPGQSLNQDLSSLLPTVYFLSGLTCTHENFIQKAGAQRYAAEHGLILVNPDTSPRGLNLPGEDESYDFGTGAGFYLDATENPWKEYYNMYSYITKELIEVVENNLPMVSKTKRSIMGHSMGGHGALVAALKNPTLYQSVSTFAPIANPMQCPWGQKIFKGYLGPDEEEWKHWDSTELAKAYQQRPLTLFIDQGSNDEFLESKQLLPEHLLEVIATNDKLSVIWKMRQGYDHGYYYVSTFIGEHLAYHAKNLQN